MAQDSITYEWDGDSCGWVAGWHDPEQGYMTAWLLPGILTSPVEDPEDLQAAAEAEGAPAGLPVEMPADPDDPMLLRDLLERMQAHFARFEATISSDDIARAICDLQIRLDELEEG